MVAVSNYRDSGARAAGNQRHERFNHGEGKQNPTSYMTTPSFIRQVV